MPTNLLVRDLMSRDLVTCPPDANLASVAQIVARRRIHAAFVVDEAGRPTGVVSDFDLLAGEWMGDDAERLRAMKSMTAGELQSSPIETIGDEEDAVLAAARMRELHLSRLLVVDDTGSPVGVISVSDLVAPLSRASTARDCVRDVMSHAIVTCPPDAGLAAAARAMTERRSRSIVVVDADSGTVGVITGNDLLSLYEAGASAATVADLMSPPITCDPGLSLSAAVELMVRNDIHRLVVVDSSHAAPLGVVSTADIVAEMAQEGSVWQERVV
jgi:CBS domain-containing protein